MTETGPQVASFDSQTISTNPSYNYGGFSTVSVQTTGSRRGWFYFALPTALPGDTIVSATLRLYQKGAATGGSRTLTVQRAAAQWTESKITHNNQPGVTGATATCVLGDSAVDGREWTFDVTALIAQVAAGDPWYGFRLSSDIATVISFYSSEASVFRPTLEIEYEPDVDAPINLRPGNDNAVSIARPTLQWASLLADTISAYRAQISTASDFSTFVGGQDSGQTFSTFPEHTINFDLVAGTTYYWRVKVWNAAGIESDYSDAEQFTRTAKPTLTIDNPAADPNDYVTEATPPFAWTVTGGTQVDYQVQVWRVPTTTNPVLLHDSLTQDGATAAYTPSSDIAFNTTDTYRLVVRIWDDVARESTPGDPDYVEASRDFTFVPQASVSGVATIVATTDVTPYATLTVTRATAPDFFQVFAAGVPISGLIVPSDVFVSGTTYDIPVLNLYPRRTYPTLTVAAIVGGVTSSVNPTVSVTTEPEGIWLCAADGSNPVCIASDDSIGNWTTGETSAVHQPVGSPYAVIRWQSRGGRNSEVSGFLVGDQPGLDDIDITEWTERWDALTEPLGQKLLLTLTDSSLPVYIRKPLRTPANEEGDVPVSFEAYERPAS